MRRAVRTAWLLPVLLVVGCTAATPPSDSASPTTARPSVSPVAVSVPPSGDALPAELAATIVADAAKTLGVDPAAVVIVSVEATTWNDGSLGCPEPGQNYTQALVDGFRVIVAAGDEQLDYRTGGGGSYRRCEPFQPGG